MGFHEQITPGGYNLAEVASAFQKCVRRGLEEEALFWLTELVRGNFQNYAWRRMAIMVSEDIGTANPQLPQQFSALYDLYQISSSRNNRGHNINIYHAAILLIQSEKNHYVHWAYGTAWDEHEALVEDTEIPDFALDLHTIRGKKRGRNIKDFMLDGANLHPHKPQPGEADNYRRCYLLWVKEPIDPDQDKYRYVDDEGFIS